MNLGTKIDRGAIHQGLPTIPKASSIGFLLKLRSEKYEE